MLTYQLLPTVDRTERASLKGNACVQMLKTGMRDQGTSIRVEILAANSIHDGLEVFARVWLAGKQVGFGYDGSVDIERFRFFNPPILVNDSHGDISQEWDDIDGNHHVRKMREDPDQAVLESLLHTIQVSVRARQIGSKKIVSGRVGSTTDTINPSAENHASYYNGGIPATWATMRGGAGTQHDSTTATYDTMIRQSQNAPPTNWRQSVRGAYTFNTNIGAGETITSVVFSLYGTAGTWTLDNISAAQRLFVVTSHASLTGGNDDYNIANYGSTLFASFDPGAAGASWNTAGYNDFTFNAAGIAGINKTGNTYLGCWLAAELNNDEPSDNVTDYVRWQATAYTVNQAGTANDPKLVIVHSSSAVKTWNGLAIASRKTNNGLAAASVKTINGLA